MKILAHLEWREGAPPRGERTTPMLVIGRPLGVPHDAAADNRPSLFLAHYRDQGLVPARVRGMNTKEARPTIAALFWAEIHPPASIELAPLTEDDRKG